MNDHSQSLAYVRGVIADLPSALTEALTAELPALGRRPTRVVTTGIGGSEGPARMLAALLGERGVAARFRPLSSFTKGALESADLLVLFSQGLSPNARLVLAESDRFALRWLVTSLAPSEDGPERERLTPFLDSGFVPIVIPPRSESGTLVRMLGPTVATLLTLRLAALLTSDARLSASAREAPATYRAAARSAPLSGDAPARLLHRSRREAEAPVRSAWRGPPLRGSTTEGAPAEQAAGSEAAVAGCDAAGLALVTVGVDEAAAHGHRWKLLEALREGDPPIWDILQFAHGPLQSYFGRPLTLVVLERGAGSPLVPRLQSIIDRDQHRLVHLTSEHASELCWFEHAGALDALILATLERAARDMFDWPARGCDGPLYGFGGGR